jgi:hypothetical protein
LGSGMARTSLVFPGGRWIRAEERAAAGIMPPRRRSPVSASRTHAVRPADCRSKRSYSAP